MKDIYLNNLAFVAGPAKSLYNYKVIRWISIFVVTSDVHQDIKP